MYKLKLVTFWHFCLKNEFKIVLNKISVDWQIDECIVSAL